MTSPVYVTPKVGRFSQRVSSAKPKQKTTSIGEIVIRQGGNVRVNELFFFYRQLIWIAVSIPVMILISMMPREQAKRFSIGGAILFLALLVAVPVLAGALLRLVAGVLVDHIGPKKTGIIAQLIVLAGLLAAWLVVDQRA